MIFLIVFLTLIISISEREEETKFVSKFFSYLLGIVSIWMILNSIIQFLSNINDLFTVDFWLSFGIEPLVWILNLPVIYIIREMVFIEKKILFSEYKNRLFPYLRFYIELKKRQSKLKKYANTKVEDKILGFIDSSKELSAVGGNRIYIKLNRASLSNEILIAIVGDAILGKNSYTKIINKREKYPNVVEIFNSENKLCAFWQDNFVASQYRNNDKIEGMNYVETTLGIKLIK